MKNLFQKSRLSDSQTYQILVPKAPILNPFNHGNNVNFKNNLRESTSKLTISKSIISIVRVHNVKLK